MADRRAPNGRDLFPGFSVRRLRGAGAEVFARVGGSGAPLLLLHGYPQTHACWHKVHRSLAVDYTVVACDLRGYGDSGTLSPPDVAAFSKRAMAGDLVAAMTELGFERFHVAAHDRGARVAYRLVLDHPDRVRSLAVMSVLPTFAMWSELQNNAYAMQAFRWFLLAQPEPLPELLLGAAGAAYVRHTLSAWTEHRDLTAFDARALAAYERAHTTEAGIAASCNDYRAAWSVDRFHDREDLEAGRKIACPVLIIWGEAEFPDRELVLRAWKAIASNVQLHALPCGHFVAEERPADVSNALAAFCRQA
jgi:haloacetate dehalogenase